MENDVILKTITRMIIPFIQAFGIYVILHGHLSPGGAFAGGALVAAAFLLGSMVLGPTTVAGRPWGKPGRVLECFGGIWYLLFGFAGFFVGAGFLTNAASGFSLGQPGNLLSGGMIPLLGFGLGIKVTATFVTLFRGLAGGLEDD